jgi:hypothetical protein
LPFSLPAVVFQSTILPAYHLLFISLPAVIFLSAVIFLPAKHWEDFLCLPGCLYILCLLP